MTTRLIIGERRDINTLGSSSTTPSLSGFHNAEVNLPPATVHAILKKLHYCYLWKIGDVVMVGVSEAGATEETLGVILRRLAQNSPVLPG